MTNAQKAFVSTSWLFIILSGMFFLVPSSHDSVEGAAWTCLTAGLVSHVALLVAIIYDRTPPTKNPAPE